MAIDNDLNRIYLISIDNLRSDCVGANPNKGALSRFHLKRFPTTPALDTFLESGAFFSRCFAAAPYTTASHASILTGLYPLHHGIREYYRTPLAASAKTLFQHFKEAGFITILATDFPVLIGPILGFTNSVDYFIEENDDRVLELLTSLQSEKVFCFWHFGSVHNPFGLTSPAIDGDHFEREVERLAENVGVPRPTKLDGEWIERSRDIKERLLRQWYFSCTDLMYEQVRYDELMNLYAAGIEYFDRHRFRNVLAGIRASGHADNALWALTADHGEEYSERAFAHFNGLWDGIVNVPLILCGPKIPQGKKVDAVCRTIDIAPTILDYAGIASAENNGLDGISLRSHIDLDLPLDITAMGESLFGYTERIRVFLEQCSIEGRLLESNIMANTHLQFARDRRWKLVIRTDLEQGTRSLSLFDTVKDPQEQRNVIDDYPEAANILENQLSGLIDPVSVPDLSLGTQRTKEIASALADMGYLKYRDGESSF